jgi:hypothetical protein
MPAFNFVKQVDCGALHKLLIQNGFDVVGVSFDSGTNITTIELADTETKDPTSIVNSYVYVPYVPVNYPQLYSDASATVQNALNQYNSAVTTYNSAVASYTAALTVWNNAATPTNLATAVIKINASEQMTVACASAIQAEATALQAAKDSIAALVSVVTVLARKNRVVEE